MSAHLERLYIIKLLYLYVKGLAQFTMCIFCMGFKILIHHLGKGENPKKLSEFKLLSQILLYDINFIPFNC
jgi:hypothetical protein